jgi:hypothetical protein
MISGENALYLYLYIQKCTFLHHATLSTEAVSENEWIISFVCFPIAVRENPQLQRLAGRKYSGSIT